MMTHTGAQQWWYRLRMYTQNVFPGPLVQRAFFVTLTGLILMAYWKHG